MEGKGKGCGIGRGDKGRERCGRNRKGMWKLKVRDVE